MDWIDGNETAPAPSDLAERLIQVHNGSSREKRKTQW